MTAGTTRPGATSQHLTAYFEACTVARALTDADLARATGIPRTRVHALLTGQGRAWSIAELCKACDAFGLDVSDVLLASES